MGLPNLDRIADSIGEQLKALPMKTTRTHKKFEKVPREPEERMHRTITEDDAPPYVEPATDTNGEALSVEEILEALTEISIAKLNVDRDAKRTAKHPEQQANRVKNLMNRYNARAKELEKLLAQARKHEAWERGQAEYRIYGLETEANLAVTNLMDETVRWFFARIDDMKDEVSDRIREGLDGIEDPGINSVPFRERLYEELVSRGIIESWEPMEF